MIRISLLCMFLLLVLTSEAQMRSDLTWKNTGSLIFDIATEDYSTDSIYFYHAFMRRSLHEETMIKDSTFSFSEHAKPLDIYKYWEQKGDDQYDVLFTKVAYVLDQPSEFFTEERLSDPQYIAQTMPSAKIHQNDSTYHISVGFGAPEIDYTLHFYSAKELQAHYPELNQYLITYDNLEQDPYLISVQHNYHYGKIMFQETSKMSISITRYYPLNDKQTLAFNYTLNYIQNIPPSFIGGSDFLISQIKEGIKALIDETQYICRMTN